jgi:hypothetical protein
MVEGLYQCIFSGKISPFLDKEIGEFSGYYFFSSVISTNFAKFFCKTSQKFPHQKDF